MPLRVPTNPDSNMSPPCTVPPNSTGIPVEVWRRRSSARSASSSLGRSCACRPVGAAVDAPSLSDTELTGTTSETTNTHFGG